MRVRHSLEIAFTAAFFAAAAPSANSGSELTIVLQPWPKLRGVVNYEVSRNGQKLGHLLVTCIVEPNVEISFLTERGRIYTFHIPRSGKWFIFPNDVDKNPRLTSLSSTVAPERYMPDYLCGKDDMPDEPRVRNAIGNLYRASRPLP